MGRAFRRNFRFSRLGVMLTPRVASTGVTRFRRRARRAHSTFREGRYFTAKMAARRPSTVMKTPVSIFRSRGRAMRRFFMK